MCGFKPQVNNKFTFPWI